MKNTYTKNNKILRTTGVALILFLMITAAGTAFPLRPWNHTENPVFLSTGNRPYFELGASSSQGFQNSYFTTGKIFTPTLIIDFDDIYDSIGKGGLKVGANWNAESHMTAHILGVGAGVYAHSENLFQVTIPSGLFELLSKGNEIDKTVSGTGEAFLQSYVEYGGYGSYRWEPYTFGAKLGKYIPLAYSSGGEARYEFTTNKDGTIDATATIDTNLYSAIDIESLTEGDEDVDPMAVLNESGGLKVDLGVVYNPDRSRPLWGASITNIPLYAPFAEYGWEFTAEGSASTEGLLDSLEEDEDEDGDESEPFDTSSTSDFTPIEDISKRLYMPFGINGFYRYTRVPLIDIIGHGGLVIAKPFRYNLGATVEGSFFPLSILSLSLAHEDMAWRSSAGIRINLRILELGIQAGFSSPELLGMFSTRGFTTNIVLGIGF